jgi:hypothetical protein
VNGAAGVILVAAVSVAGGMAGAALIGWARWPRTGPVRPSVFHGPLAPPGDMPTLENIWLHPQDHVPDGPEGPRETAAGPVPPDTTGPAAPSGTVTQLRPGHPDWAVTQYEWADGPPQLACLRCGTLSPPQPTPFSTVRWATNHEETCTP